MTKKGIFSPSISSICSRWSINKYLVGYAKTLIYIENRRKQMFTENHHHQNFSNHFYPIAKEHLCLNINWISKLILLLEHILFKICTFHSQQRIFFRKQVMKAVKCSCLSHSRLMSNLYLLTFLKYPWAAFTQANTLKPINSKNAYKIKTYWEVLNLILKNIGTIINILNNLTAILKTPYNYCYPKSTGVKMNNLPKKNKIMIYFTEKTRHNSYVLVLMYLWQLVILWTIWSQK